MIPEPIHVRALLGVPSEQVDADWPDTPETAQTREGEWLRQHTTPWDRRHECSPT